MGHRIIRYLYLPLIITALAVTGCKTSKKTVATVKPEKEQTVIGGKYTRDLEGDSRLLVDEAMTWLGTPYRYGGQDYKGTDCSGMTMQVYNKALGIVIPRNSREQQKFCKTIQKGALTPGDLVFFCTGKDPSRVSHVGIYLGQGQFIHSSSSKGVIISNLDERYYTSKYHSSGFVERSTASVGKKKKTEKTKTKTEKVEKPLETTPLRFEIPAKKTVAETERTDMDHAIESKLDSIYTDFLD